MDGIEPEDFPVLSVLQELRETVDRQSKSFDALTGAIKDLTNHIGTGDSTTATPPME